MAAIDEVPDIMTAEAPNVWTWDDGHGASTWVVRRAQAQSLWNLRDGAGQMDWSTDSQLSYFDATSQADIADLRTNLLKHVARVLLWVDQIDARVQR